MRILLQKGRDKPSTLRCLREDGTETWTSLKSIPPHHDLMHFAVESVLEYRDAFFGLIAQGWNIEDFTTRLSDGTFRPMPLEATHAETLVILMQGEHAGGSVQSDLLPLAATACADFNLPPPQVTAEQASRIRSLFRECWESWSQLPPGGTLEVSFP